MFNLPRTKYIVLGIILFLVTGCMTRVTGTWKNSDYQGKEFSSVMVVGLTPDPTNRLKWENLMAEELLSYGVKTVVTSLNVFPDDREIDEQEIIDYVTEKNIKGVLVTRLVDTKKETIRRAAPVGGGYVHYRDFGTYYAFARNQVSTTSYLTTRTTVLLETNLYETKNQNLIWSVSSDTIDSSSVDVLIKSVTQKVAGALQKDKLI